MLNFQLKNCILYFVLAATLPGCQKVITQKEKSSYSKGYFLGQQFLRDKEDLDPETFWLGFQDAVKAGKTNEDLKISVEEMKLALEKDFSQKTVKTQEQIASNKIKSENFLKENASKSGVEQTSSGLQYLITKPGAGPVPQINDYVRIKYVAKLVSGEEFERSPDTGLLTPIKGAMPGWAEGLALMKVGSQFTLFIPPNLGFGPSSRGQILPESALVYEMELMAIEAPPEQQKPASKSKASKKSKSPAIKQ